MSGVMKPFVALEASYFKKKLRIKKSNETQKRNNEPWHIEIKPEGEHERRDHIKELKNSMDNTTNKKNLRLIRGSIVGNIRNILSTLYNRFKTTIKISKNLAHRKRELFQRRNKFPSQAIR